MARRPIVPLLFAAIFVAELGWSGVAPLLPSYQARDGLSDVSTGLILSIAAMGILAVSLPASALANRFSVRSLTLWGSLLLTGGNLLVGFSGSYAPLVIGRCLYGIGLGTMWVTGTAWLHDEAGERGAHALAATTAVVGAGSLIGPVLTGHLGERFGLGVPFVLLGALTAATTLVLWLAPSERGREPEPGPPLREMVRAAGADHVMLVSLVVALVVSLMWLTTELLVPLRLSDIGYSSGDIGLAFSAASVVFVGASMVTAQKADRYATVRIAAAWTALCGAGLVIAAVSQEEPATLAFLIVAGITSGVMIALTYPLGVLGARQGGYSVAVVGSLLNTTWAGAGVVGPTVGGMIRGSGGDRVAFGALAALGIVSAAWMWVRRDREAGGPSMLARSGMDPAS